MALTQFLGETPARGGRASLGSRVPVHAAFSYAFGKRCRDAGVMPSMGSIGDAYDNAMAESFFATLEREVLNRRRFRSQAEARMAIFQWLEGWYNPHRRHSALGYRSPINYERRQLPQSA